MMENQNGHGLAADQGRERAGNLFDGMFRGLMSGSGGTVHITIGIVGSGSTANLNGGGPFGQDTRNAPLVNQQAAAPNEREVRSDIPDAQHRTRAVVSQTVPPHPPPRPLKPHKGSNTPAPSLPANPKAPALEDQGLGGLDGSPKTAVQSLEDAGPNIGAELLGAAVGERASKQGVSVAGKSAEGTGFAGAGVRTVGGMVSDSVADKAAAKERARKRRESLGWPASPVLHTSNPPAGVIGADGEKVCSEKSPKRGAGTAAEGKDGGAATDPGQKGVSHKKQKGGSHKKARVAKGAEDETSRMTPEETKAMLQAEEPRVTKPQTLVAALQARQKRLAPAPRVVPLQPLKSAHKDSKPVSLSALATIPESSAEAPADSSAPPGHEAEAEIGKGGEDFAGQAAGGSGK